MTLGFILKSRERESESIRMVDVAWSLRACYMSNKTGTGNMAGLDSISFYSPGKSTTWFWLLHSLAWRRLNVGARAPCISSTRLIYFWKGKSTLMGLRSCLTTSKSRLQNTRAALPRIDCRVGFSLVSWIPESPQWSCQRRGCWSQSCSWKCSSPAIRVNTYSPSPTPPYPPPQ